MRCRAAAQMLSDDMQLAMSMPCHDVLTAQSLPGCAQSQVCQGTDSVPCQEQNNEVQGQAQLAHHAFLQGQLMPCVVVSKRIYALHTCFAILLAAN